MICSVLSRERDRESDDHGLIYFQAHARQCSHVHQPKSTLWHANVCLSSSLYANALPVLDFHRFIKNILNEFREIIELGRDLEHHPMSTTVPVEKPWCALKNHGVLCATRLAHERQS